MTHQLHLEHKKHRNVLYSLVVLLAIIQIVTFLMLSIQISKLNVKIDVESEKTTSESRKFVTDLVSTYNTLYQGNFKEISEVLIQQREDFEQDVKMLQSSQEDFSSVVEESIKGVVTVSTTSSIGSGFFISSDGYVVTNHHVIAAQEGEMHVITYTNEVLVAEVIGSDPTRDLALLK